MAELSEEKKRIQAAEIEKLSKRVIADGCTQERFEKGLRSVISFPQERLKELDKLRAKR